MNQPSGTDRSRLSALVAEQLQRIDPFDELSKLMAKLVDRTRRLDALLAELDRTDQLDAVITELQRNRRLHVLDALMIDLFERTDQLDAVVTKLDQTDHFDTLMADLMERTGHIDAVVAALERAIARPPHQP
jgi:hypothetical protein